MPGKNSSTGPIAAVNKQDLETLEDIEVPKYTKVNAREIDNIVTEMWFKVYHAVVLLAATTSPPRTHLLNDRDEQGEQKPKDNSHLVPAFTTLEGEDGESTGWIFRDIKDIFNKPVVNLKIGKKFHREVIQKIEINGARLPLLRHFMGDLDRTIFNDSNFDPVGIRRSCEATLAEMVPATRPDVYHAESINYATKALTKIQDVWAQIDDFDDVQTWLAGAQADEIGTEEWLTTELQLDTVKQLIKANFNDLSDGDKLTIALSTRAIDINRTTFGLICNRLADKDDDSSKSDGLVEATKKLATGLTDQEAWPKLLAVTYGAITWLIYQQAKSTTDNVRNILEGN